MVNGERFRGQRSDVRRQRTEDRDSPVGAAFQPRSCDFYDFKYLNGFKKLTTSIICDMRQDIYDILTKAPCC